MPPRKAPATKTPPQIHLSEEKKAQLEQELNWCIQQLELGLTRKDADKFQIQETKRVLTTLQSNVSDVQKRQLMKVVFGDYRKLMKEDKKQREEEENKKKLKEASSSTSSDNVPATEPSTTD